MQSAECRMQICGGIGLCEPELSPSPIINLHSALCTLQSQYRAIRTEALSEDPTSQLCAPGNNSLRRSNRARQLSLHRMTRRRTD